MKVGIIGLSQSGVTTVFNAVTGAHGEVGGFHAGGATNVALVKVPDERLEFLVELFGPKKTRPAVLELDDIAGVFAHMGHAGTDSAQAVASARDRDALVLVLRAFQDTTVPHVLGSVDPARDLARMQEELLLADLAVVENRIEKIGQDLKRPLSGAEKEALREELDLLGRCQAAIEEQRGVRSVQMISAEEKMLRSYAFLTLKPQVCVLNVGEGAAGEPPALANVDPPPVVMTEGSMEIMDLEEADRAEFLQDAGIAEPATGRLVGACFAALGLRAFFTYAHDEVGCWTVQAGDDAVTAAGKVHTDMARGFIRAEVVAFDDLKACGSIKEAKAQGKVRLEGRDYEVRDGDVITFRHSG